LYHYVFALEGLVMFPVARVNQMSSVSIVCLAYLVHFLLTFGTRHIWPCGTFQLAILRFLASDLSSTSLFG